MDLNNPKKKYLEFKKRICCEVITLFKLSCFKECKQKLKNINANKNQMPLEFKQNTKSLTEAIRINFVKLT